MEHEVVEVPARRLSGMVRTYTMEEMGEIPKLWHDFGRVCEEMNFPERPVMYGVSMMGPEGIRYGALVEASDLPGEAPQGFEPLDLPGGKYLKFRHVGPPEGIKDIFGQIFGWLPSSNYTPDDRPALERYDERYCSESLTEIFIAVKD